MFESLDKTNMQKEIRESYKETKKPNQNTGKT